VVGCGVIAYWAHLRVLRRIRGATLTAAADPNPEARERAKRLAGVAVYERAEDLIRRGDIDAVVISAPSHLHAELAIATAAAGKHFYLEKPIATTVQDAQRVTDAAADAGVTAAMGFNRRLHPLYEQARQLLLGDHIGPVRAVQTAFCEPIPAEAMPEWKQRRATGGGVLLDLASHHLDLLRWFLGDEVASVAASIQSQLSEQDTARLELSMQSGIEVQSFFSFRAGRADFLEFIGERGTLRIDRHSPVLAMRLGRRFGYGTRTRWVPPTVAVAGWRLHRLVRPSTDPSYRRSLQAFIDRLHNIPGKIASLADGVCSLEAIVSAEESGSSAKLGLFPGRPVRIPCAPC
jgi:myo-inositol 2-dehydrogenase / D-chiro-inositol 1-dehydrogenase